MIKYYLINNLKKNFILSIDAGKKGFDKIQYSHIIKIPRTLGIKDNFLNVIKNIYKSVYIYLLF